MNKIHGLKNQIGLAIVAFGYIHYNATTLQVITLVDQT